MQESISPLEILSKAISEVGYWRWWTAKFPKAILLEFGGVQLYSRATRDDQPPTGSIALTFRRPKSVCFIDFSRDLEGEWSQQLQDDEIEPFELDKNIFGFNNERLVGQLMQKATRVNTLHGYKPQKGLLPEAPITMGFSAGPVGVCIAAESLEIRTNQGLLELDQVEDASNKWWNYWKEYWQNRETSNALPKDYTCEATTPESARA